MEPAVGSQDHLAHRLRAEEEPERVLRSGRLRALAGVASSADAIARADRGIARLHRLVDEIVAVESLSGARPGGAVDDHDLGGMMERALAPARRVARARGIAFRVRYDPSLRLHVDTAAAIEALTSVIDGAVGAGDGAEIDIEVEDRGSEVAVHVSEAVTRGEKLMPDIDVLVPRRPLEWPGWSISAEWSLSARCHVCLTLPAAAPP
jgi:signal transduction histidine kinase